jgi:hypothetical protein
MSYNPARMAPGGLKRRRQAPDPHAGTKHSDIVRARGVGFTVGSTVNRELTPQGFSVPVFDGEGFSVRQEAMTALNHAGTVVNQVGDKVVRVNRGVLFVTLYGSDGVPVTKSIAEGGCVELPKGTKYALATGTLDAELLVVESPDYASTTEMISAPEAINQQAPMVVPATAQATPRRTGTKAHEQAAQLVAQQQPARQGRRPAARANRNDTSFDNPNSANAIGVNPRPIIPTDD